MTPEQDQRAREFAHRIGRNIELREKPAQNGFDLLKPDGTRIGFVRYTIRGTVYPFPYYTVYAYADFRDPRGVFQSASEGGQYRNRRCYIFEVRSPLENGAAWRLPARCAAASCLRSSLIVVVRRAFRSCKWSTLPIRSSCSQGGRALSVHMAEV